VQIIPAAGEGPQRDYCPFAEEIELSVVESGRVVLLAVEGHSDYSKDYSHCR
jgi:hypothetical protein